jgi:hypothetical protein
MSAQHVVSRAGLFVLILFSSAPIPTVRARNSVGPVQVQETSEERKLTIHEYKDIPLQVLAVRNLQSHEWCNDLEIEVKNVSKKPIYFIYLYLIADKPPHGEIGISLHYGKHENRRLEHLADPGDPHIDPDESYVFTLSEPERIAFEATLKKYPGRDKNLLFGIALVNFGDGTGFDVFGNWRTIGK